MTDSRSTLPALERVRALAARWTALEGDSLQAEIDRRTGSILLSAVSDEGSTEDFRLADVTRLAEAWMTPGNSFYYPAAGASVLDAIKGGGTLYGHYVVNLTPYRDEFYPDRSLEWVAGHHDGLTQDRSKLSRGDADYGAGWYHGYVRGCDRVAEVSGTCVPEDNREYWDHVGD